jgi:DNA-directed RNA polymerase specialized sigma24 family protein
MPSITRLMSTQSSRKFRSLCETRLDEIAATDIATLTQFAECRLMALGCSPSSGEDLAQRAFLAVIQGLETDRGGRRPRLVDVESKDAFTNYLRGVVASMVEAMTRKQEFRSEHVPLDDELLESAVPDGGRSPAEQAELSDLAEQLFPRLLARAPHRLVGSIQEWESIFSESDRIPAHGHPRNPGEVKELARQVVTELGGIR